MDIKQLRYFDAVVRHKSFSQAAIKLYVAQPALGLQIKKLEEELGVQLLIRNTRGVELTDAGHMFLEKSRAILTDVDRIKKDMADFSGPMRGRLSIGITPTIASLLALPLLERCRRELPHVTINLVEDLGSVLTEWLLTDRLDMALAFSVPPTLGLSNRTLVEDSAYFISTDSSTDDPIEFSEVLERQLILPSQPNRLRHFLEEEARARRKVLDVCIEVQAPSTILNLVANGFGATIMSIVSSSSLLDEGKLTARPIVNPTVSYPISLVRSDSNPMSKAEAAVQAIVIELVDSIVSRSSTRS